LLAKKAERMGSPPASIVNSGQPIAFDSVYPLQKLLIGLIDDLAPQYCTGSGQHLKTSVEFLALIRLYGEFIEAGLFSHDHYARMVIAVQRLNAARPLVHMRREPYSAGSGGAGDASGGYGQFIDGDGAPPSTIGPSSVESGASGDAPPLSVAKPASPSANTTGQGEPVFIDDAEHLNVHQRVSSYLN
jgi:hypothetical protein